MKIIKERKYFQTADLALAAVISLSHSIESIERDNPHKVNFSFKQDRDLKSLIEGYWQGALKVEPQAYFAQLRIIKARIYGDR